MTQKARLVSAWCGGLSAALLLGALSNGCGLTSEEPQTSSKVSEEAATTTEALTASTELNLDPAGSYASSAAIANNGTVSLVAWADSRTGYTIYGAIVTLNASGNPILATLAGANPFPIATNVGADTTINAPRVAASKDGSNFLVVWTKNNVATGLDLVGAKITAAGVVGAAATLSNAAGNQTTPRLATNGSMHLLAWDDKRSGSGQLYAARISTAGASPAATDASGLLADGTAYAGSSAAVASDGVRFLLAYRGSGPNLAKLFDPASGAFSVAASFGNSTSNTVPSLIWGGTHYLAGFSDVATKTQIARISAAGAAVDAVGSARTVATDAANPGQPVQLATIGDGATVFAAFTGTGGDLSGALFRLADTTGLTPTTALMTQGNSIAALGIGSNKAMVAGYVVVGGVWTTRVAVVTSGLSVGAACTTSAQCGSGACVTGVCCSSACSNTCQTCSVTPGTCTSVVSADNPGLCTGANTCNAGGVCKKKNGQTCTAAGNCASANCVDGTCCNSACSGDCDRCNLAGKEGTCSIATLGTPGVPACVGSTVCDGVNPICPTTCVDDTMCAVGDFCNSVGKCQSQVPQGQACNPAADCKAAGCRECVSGNCADGVCCDTACNGSCDSCKVTPGTCTITVKGTFGSPSCSPYLCGGSSASCPATCTANTDCVTGAFCDTVTGTCKGSDPNGSACSADPTCQSQHCVDGVCCDTACEGQCQACDVASSVGSCAPVSGAPHGKRSACDAASNGDACSARLCDGAKDVTTCVGYVGTDVGCRNASCVDGTETATDTCDGAGTCGSGTPRSRACAPYACGAAACLTECAVSADCVSGATCDPSSKRCVNAAECIDDHTLRDPNGAVSDCGAFRCRGGACLTRCNSIVECVSPNACSTSGSCVPPALISGAGAGEGESTGGCSVSAGEESRAGTTRFLALALCVGGALRRRGRRAR